MKVVNSYDVDGRTVCFVCEQDQPGDYVDTEFSFWPNGVTALDGPKRVCTTCVTRMALTLGYANNAEVAAYQERIHVLAGELDDAVSHAAVVEALADLSEKLDAYKPNHTKQQPSKTPAKRPYVKKGA